MSKRFRAISQERGVALILTLAMLALVTLLVIAFVTSMRIESMGSKNYNSVVMARELVNGAIDQAVAQIRLATPSRLPNGNAVVNYVTYPGGAYVNNNGNLTQYPLYSGPTSADQTNLNSGLWITGGTNSSGEFLPNNANSAINVGWLYVDNAGNVYSPPSPGFGNPLVGRIAYWVDDEASKINVNTAGVPSACGDPFGACSTSNNVDLTMLLPTPFGNALDIQSGGSTFPRATYPYTTIQEIKRANTAITADRFDDNRFEITTYSTDANYPLYSDDLDAFDRQREIISQLNNPRDIDGTLDATGTLSAYTRLSDGNLGQMYFGSQSSFASKYGGKAGVQQIIANIIAYQQDPSQAAPPDSNSGSPLTAPTYLGLGKTPYINEVQVQYQVSGGPLPQPVAIQRTVAVELYYLYNGTYTNGTEQIVVSGLPSLGLGFQPQVTIGIGAGGLLSSGSYGVYKDAPETQQSTSPTISLPQQTLTVVYSRQYGVGLRRLSFAQPTVGQSGGQTLNLAAPSATIVYQGAQAGDPCSVFYPAQWQPYPNATVTIGTMGGRNVWNVALGLPPGGSSSGFPFIGDNSKMGVMRGAPMQSIGELGFIHTPNAFQYLSLQPNTTAGQIPDWAILDLFTVGAGGNGRININSYIDFNPNNPTPNPATWRLAPLEALLSGAGISSASTRSSIAQNIYEDQISDRGRKDSYGMPNVSRFGIFDTIGEICEIPALANGAVNNQANAEAVIRRIANLITVRSNTFTIWALAQSIKQPTVRSGIPLGQFDPTIDVITGNVKAQAVVERYEILPIAAGNTPKYRTRYFRYLYN
jgi:hypothetical protein